MALNLSTVIRRIESRLGLSHQVLELTQEDLLDIITQDTLPTFSKHYPYIVEIDIDKNDKVPGGRSEYFIKTDLEIIGVEDLITGGTLNDYNGYTNSFYMDPIASKMSADIASSYMHPELFRFYPPNRIRIMPENYIRSSGITVRVRAVHPEHLMTIPLTLREEFMKLAFYDVCMALYPIRYNFTNIATSFGNIEMFMEHLETAQDKRDELLEKFHTDSLKYSRRRKIFIM